MEIYFEQETRWVEELPLSAVELVDPFVGFTGLGLVEPAYFSNRLNMRFGNQDYREAIALTFQGRSNSTTEFLGSPYLGCCDGPQAVDGPHLIVFPVLLQHLSTRQSG